MGGCLLAQVAAAATEWELVSRGFEEAAASAVAACDQARIPTSLLYAAAGDGVYASADGGQTWRSAFRVPGQGRVTELALACTAAPATSVLAATDHGVYGSWDGGMNWSQVLSGTSEGQDEATVVAFHPQQGGLAMAGTRGGLFVSRDEGRTWQPMNLPQEARRILHGTWDSHHPDRLWMVTEEGLFAGDLAGGQWQQRFGVVDAAEELPPEAEEVEEQDSEQTRERLNAVALDSQRPGSVWLATSRGVYESVDEGVAWQRVSQSGLLSSDVSRLVAVANSPTILYAGTARGVARYDAAAQQWTLLSEGLAMSEVHDMEMVGSVLWAATEQGLYRARFAADEIANGRAPSSSSPVVDPFLHEPSVREVQEVAVRYAEVHPEKISQWRTQARLRALVPTLSAGVSNNVTDKWHWESGSTAIGAGYDDHLLRGKSSLEWDTTLTWDLGDMIYSADQTSIDVRSKLMVQLRDDIVDEVTRTYFERRRVQLALLTDPPKDPTKQMEKELRVQELTALIDGLTGGWFSQELDTRRGR